MMGLYERLKSRITDAERAGIPKGERNNNPKPDYTEQVLSMLPNHDPSYVHSGVRLPDTKAFAEYLESVGVDVSKLSDSDLQYLMQARKTSITHPEGEHGIVDVSPWGEDFDIFNGNNKTGNVSYLTNKRDQSFHVSHLHKNDETPSGFSRKAYDLGIDYAHRRGLSGVVSGESLASPEQTYRVWEHYPTRQRLDQDGFHIFNRGRDVTRTGEEHSIDYGPVMLLSEPSSTVLPYKHTSFFHPALIRNGVLQAPKWNVNNPFFSKGGKLQKK